MVKIVKRSEQFAMRTLLAAIFSTYSLTSAPSALAATDLLTPITSNILERPYARRLELDGPEPEPKFFAVFPTLVRTEFLSEPPSQPSFFPSSSGGGGGSVLSAPGPRLLAGLPPFVVRQRSLLLAPAAAPEPALVVDGRPAPPVLSRQDVARFFQRSFGTTGGDATAAGDDAAPPADAADVAPTRILTPLARPPLFGRPSFAPFVPAASTRVETRVRPSFRSAAPVRADRGRGGFVRNYLITPRLIRRPVRR